MNESQGFQVKARDHDGNVHDEHWTWSREVAEGIAAEVQHDPQVADAWVEPPALSVTLPLAGLPDSCPHCGAPAPDGEWALGSHRGILQVICPRCFTAVAPVRAVAAHHEDRP